MSKNPSQTVVHKSARDAWDHFSNLCGVESSGRDRDFLEQLKEKLDPAAPDLDGAIDGATNDALVRGIFDCVAPFAAMSRDILTFFKRAAVHKGRAQWALVVDDVPFDLQHFVDFIRESRNVWGHFERPILDHAAAISLQSVITAARPIATDRRMKDPFAGLRSISSAPYRPWPSGLEPDRLPPELQELAQIGQTVLGQIRQRGLSRDQIMKSSGAILGPDAILDGEALRIAESDFWLPQIIDGLDAARKLPRTNLEALGPALAAIVGPLPTIIVAAEIDVGDLKKILSLPVWERRHEVYAAWIATRLVDAMPRDVSRIHNENGEIRFAFRETKVASISRRSGDIVLFSERKQPLAKPIGKGRKGATKPDFGLWKEATAGKRCALIVEVKHYALAATRSFTEVLVDYARAHSEAQVVLVNYGPTADMMDRLDTAPIKVSPRCHHIPDLTPYNAVAQQRLVDFMAAAMKQLDRSDRLLLVDVSGSMEPYLKHDSFRAWLEGPDNEDVDRVLMVDREERWEGSRNEAIRWIRTYGNWGVEDLALVARSMLERSDRLDFVTDKAGLDGLEANGDFVVESDRGGLPDQLVLASVRRLA